MEYQICTGDRGGRGLLVYLIYIYKIREPVMNHIIGMFGEGCSNQMFSLIDFQALTLASMCGSHHDLNRFESVMKLEQACKPASLP